MISQVRIFPTPQNCQTHSNNSSANNTSPSGFFKSFLANVPFYFNAFQYSAASLCLLKTPENESFSDVFRVIEILQNIGKHYYEEHRESS